MKNSKLLFVCLLALVFVTSVVFGTMCAFASEATKDHEFSRGDVVFEDFDRADISDTVTATGADLGVKPYLHVEFEALTEESSAGDRTGQIYKHGSPLLAAFKNGTLTLKLRSEGTLRLSDLVLAVRTPTYDNDGKVFPKALDELVGSDEIISTTWKEYEIDHAQAYETTDLFPVEGNTSISPATAELVGIHLYAKNGVSGVLDIDSVRVNSTVLTDFTGGNGDVTAAANAANADLPWTWAGTTGHIVTRNPVLKNGNSIQIVKDAIGEGYAYAVIEIIAKDGDASNLKVATTTDGTTWGDAVAFDGYSVDVTAAVKGFKLTYEGEEADGIAIKRIYVVNTAKDAKVIPVIDTKTVEMLEDFSAAQSGFTGEYADMAAAAPDGFYYRLSYNNGDKVEIKDGCMVINFVANDFINYKFAKASLANGKYMVIKAKLGEGAELGADFRFNLLAGEEGTPGAIVAANAWKAGHNLPAAILDTPYVDSEGWAYIVIDLDESGLSRGTDGYCGLDMYMTGKGTMYIDSIFFADAAELEPVDVPVAVKGEFTWAAVTSTYTYKYMYLPNEEGYATSIEFDVTALDETLDMSNFRMQFEGVGIYWAGGAKKDGYLVTADGKQLHELTFVKDQATHVVIDLEKSGINKPFGHVHTHVETINAFKITNIVVNTVVPREEALVLDYEHALTSDASINFAGTDADPSNPGYCYAGHMGSLTGKQGGVLAMEITIAEGTDLSGVRFAFGCGERWAGGEDKPGYLITTDGQKLSEVEFEAGVAKKVEIDLVASDIDLSDCHVHSNGSLTGAFSIANVKVIPYVDYFADLYDTVVDALPAAMDTVKPVVAITTATTADEGEITVAYTATDDFTAAADLVIAVSVTKDGNDVAVANNKFTATAGVYTVVVTATDEAGNVGSATIQITVKAAEQPSGPSNPSQPGEDKPGDDKPAEEPKGLTPGAIAAIVIAVVVVAGGAVAAVIIIRKKKSSK